MSGETRITEETVKALVAGGLERGQVETEFGWAIVAKALIRGSAVFTITFVDMLEKWAVMEGGIVALKFNMMDSPQPPAPPKVNKVFDGLLNALERGNELMVMDTVKSKEEKRVEKTTKQTNVKLVEPKVARPRTKAAQEKKVGKGVKEQPPTTRAYVGRPVEKGKGKVGKATGTRDVKGEMSHNKVKVGIPTVSKKTGPVPKIGPKAPVWRRQLGSNGKPEKVDINLYPIKIVCANCGQPRYVDSRNAGIKDHPVTLCKPCRLRKKNDDHNTALRAKTAAKREMVEKEARKAVREAKVKRKG
jgi:hypothetical protein